MVRFCRMKPRHNLSRLLSLALFLALAGACAPATPIVVLVTPTQPPPTQVPGVLDTAISIISTATANAVRQANLTSPVTPSITPTGPTVTFGAVVGQHATLAAGPTLTPKPSSTASPTSRPKPTSTTSLTPTPRPTSTVTPTPLPSPTSTKPPTVTPGPSATGPTVTFGAVIGPNVTPYVPPTLTPGPTATGPTVTFGAVIGPNTTPYVPATLTPGPPPTLPPVNVTLPPLVTPGPSPTPGPILRSDLMGIQIHGYLTDEEWMHMLAYSKDLGMGWIKVQVQWKELEPAKGVFNQLFGAMVLDIQRARIQGFRTLISIAKAPGWARPPEAQNVEDGPPANPQDLADFVARFVRDCKPEFLDAIEIWNEPNLIREWRGRPLNGGEYLKYFRAAYTAIQYEQQVQPANHRIAVITAGLAPTATAPDGTSVNDRDWLQQMYTGGLAKIGPDVVVGAHPYSWANPPDATCCRPQAGVTGWFEDRSFYFRDTLDDYRKIMVRNNHAGGKLWVTEFGWGTYDGLRRSDGNLASADPRVGWETLISQGQQASYVLRAFYMAQQPPYYDFLGPMFLWNLNFGIVPEMIDDGREEAGFSLLDSGGNPRPVYLALKNAPKQ
jgi:hypothetical protein